MVQDGWGYVAATTAVHVLDLTNPAAPSIEGTVTGFGRADRIAIDGSFAYVADDLEGLHVIDISTPSSPQLVASLLLPGLFGSAKGIDVADGWAYLASSLAGIQVVDVSTPTAPRFTGSVGNAGMVLPGTASTVLLLHDVAVSGERVYAGGGLGPLLAPSGIAVAKLAGPTGTSVIEAGARPAADLSITAIAPNPFGQVTSIHFTLGAPQIVRVDVFDVGGRRVRGLGAGSRAAGTHAVTWDGRDDRGAHVGAGVYFARVSGERGEAARKIVHFSRK
jgi:hypothetical protein